SGKAWGSRGVKVGHDLPEDEWALAVREALEEFDHTRWVLQRFQSTERRVVEWYDFESNAVRRMPGRVRLTPYYFVTGERVTLAERISQEFRIRINAYYLSLIEEPGDPIWRQVVPDPAELEDVDCPDDPLNEEGDSPVPNLTHRYPDRVLFLVNHQCPIYCRF